MYRSHCLPSLCLIQLSCFSLLGGLLLYFYNSCFREGGGGGGGGRKGFLGGVWSFLFEDYDMLHWVHCQIPDLGNATTNFKRYPCL